jgi:hypothetical protein
LDDDILRRAEEYAAAWQLRLNRRLGFGKDGTVWRTHKDTAVKVFASEGPFLNESSVYMRLAEREVVAVNGFHVPQLVAVDDRLRVVEMTIVRRPFVLDFGSARLDEEPPTFSDEIMDAWLEERQEMFGENWPRAAGVIAAMRRFGIYMTDIHPGNIGF